MLVIVEGVFMIVNYVTNLCTLSYEEEEEDGEEEQLYGSE